MFVMIIEIKQEEMTDTKSFSWLKKKGYHNLAKLTSLSYVDGFYYVPRIDKKLVELYKQHLIVLTGNMYGEILKILNLGDSQAEDAHSGGTLNLETTCISN